MEPGRLWPARGHSRPSCRLDPAASAVDCAGYAGEGVLGGVHQVGPGEADDFPLGVDQVVLTGTVTSEAVGSGVPRLAINFDDQLELNVDAVANCDQTALGVVDRSVELEAFDPGPFQKQLEFAFRLCATPARCVVRMRAQ